MVTKDNFRKCRKLSKEISIIERKLNRKRRPPKGREREELEALRDQLQADRCDAELWIDDITDLFEDGRSRCIFLQVFVHGTKQKEVAALWGISAQRLSNIITEEIRALNKKAPPEEAAL